MAQSTDWMHGGDVELLRELDETGPDYAPVIAHRIEVPHDYAAERCARLAEHGFVEPISEETVYRITADGEQFLERHKAVGARGEFGLPTDD